MFHTATAKARGTAQRLASTVKTLLPALAASWAYCLNSALPHQSSRRQGGTTLKPSTGTGVRRPGLRFPVRSRTLRRQVPTGPRA